jgi:hypothetical protein
MTLLGMRAAVRLAADSDGTQRWKVGRARGTCMHAGVVLAGQALTGDSAMVIGAAKAELCRLAQV